MIISKDKTSKRYLCPPCGYVYDPAEGDPEGGIPAGTAFEDIPDDWLCPLCGVTKAEFEPENEYYQNTTGLEGSKVEG